MGTSTAARTLEQRLDEFDSRVEIGALVANYCRGVDQRETELFLGLWHPDAEYLVPGGRGEFRGLEEIRRFPDVVDKAWKSTKHWTTNHVIVFEGEERATGRSDCYAMCEHHDGKVSLVAATYDDRYERREDGVWRFAHRLVTRWFVSEGQDIALLPAF